MLAVQQQAHVMVAAVGGDAGIEFAHRTLLALQHLQEAAIDMQQQAGNAQHGIVGAAGGEDMIQRGRGQVGIGTADIKKLAHVASFALSG